MVASDGLMPMKQLGEVVIPKQEGGSLRMPKDYSGYHAMEFVYEYKHNGEITLDLWRYWTISSFRLWRW